MGKIWILFYISCFLVSSKETFTLSFNPEFTVSGTSNLKDWKMSSKQAEGKAIIKFENDKVIHIDALELSIPVYSLTSGNPQMDKNTYRVMKASEFPEIYFQLIRVLSSVKNGSCQLIKTQGNLTIGGVTRMVVVDTESESLKNKVSFKGHTTLKMSSFNIEPPTALMGKLKTGDVININFNVQFQSNNKI